MTTERPTTLLAELTHRCPLHCPYCSNPLDLLRAESEIGTEDWKRVFTQARELGVLQLGLSGGEPLIRKDLEALPGAAEFQALVLKYGQQFGYRAVARWIIGRPPKGRSGTKGPARTP